MSEARFGVPEGELEVRREGDGGVRLSGRFPYNSLAVLSDGGRSGRPMKEQIASGAFAFSVKSGDEIHLLAGHSFDRPLARKLDGSLALRDAADALSFTAVLSPALLEASYVKDVLAQIEAGLAVGVSPGFRLPPERAVPRDRAETVEEEEYAPEEGKHRALIRTVREAILFELSIVTRPAYRDSSAEITRMADYRGRGGVAEIVRRRYRWR